jgi:hypothetical protein
MAGIAFCGFIFENRHKIFSTFTRHELINSVTPGKMGQENARMWLVAAVGFSVIVDFGLIAISSKNFGHYYIVAIPALVTLINYLLYRISKLNKQM